MLQTALLYSIYITLNVLCLCCALTFCFIVFQSSGRLKWIRSSRKINEIKMRNMATSMLFLDQVCDSIKFKGMFCYVSLYDLNVISRYKTQFIENLKYQPLFISLRNHWNAKMEILYCLENDFFTQTPITLRINANDQISFAGVSLMKNLVYSPYLFEIMNGMKMDQQYSTCKSVFV